jgi:hypothetical protein
MKDGFCHSVQKANFSPIKSEYPLNSNLASEWRKMTGSSYHSNDPVASSATALGISSNCRDLAEIEANSGNAITLAAKIFRFLLN